MINLQARSSICEGDSVLLDAGPLFSNYLWNTGSTEQTIYAKNKGIYRVAAEYTNGCKSRAEFELNIWQNPSPNLSGNPVICEGTPRILSMNKTFISYLWNDGSTNSTLSVEIPGKYFVTVEDINGCRGTDTTELTTIKPVPVDFLAAYAQVCQYGKLEIVPDNSFESYLWNDYSISSPIVTAPGVYWLKVVDKNNCSGIDSINVIQKECLQGLYAPNAFTPNGDGKNDIFRPVLLGNAAKYRFSIFNRWGEKVFETTSVEKNWDGRIKGVSCNSGTYVWQCIYALEGQPERREKGFVELIR